MIFCPLALVWETWLAGGSCLWCSYSKQGSRHAGRTWRHHLPAPVWRQPTWRAATGKSFPRKWWRTKQSSSAPELRCFWNVSRGSGEGNSFPNWAENRTDGQCRYLNVWDCSCDVPSANFTHRGHFSLRSIQQCLTDSFWIQFNTITIRVVVEQHAN